MLTVNWSCPHAELGLLSDLNTSYIADMVYLVELSRP